MYYLINNFISLEQFPNKRLDKILALLFDEIKDNKVIERDQPLSWSINHMYSCSYLSKIIALIRGLNPEIAGIAGAIHDLYIIREGIFENHGPLSEPLVREFLGNFNIQYHSELGKISEEDIESICLATKLHTEKKTNSNNAFVELLKDTDSFDRFMHGHDIPDYYIPRCKAVLKDLKSL